MTSFNSLSLFWIDCWFYGYAFTHERAWHYRTTDKAIKQRWASWTGAARKKNGAPNDSFMHNASIHISSKSGLALFVNVTDLYEDGAPDALTKTWIPIPIYLCLQMHKTQIMLIRICLSIAHIYSRWHWSIWVFCLSFSPLGCLGSPF